MKQGKTLKELAAEILRQRESRRDFVADTRRRPTRGCDRRRSARWPSARPRRWSSPSHGHLGGGRRTGSRMAEEQGMSTLKAWRQVVTRHEDTRRGRFDASVSAADLSEVLAGRGAVDYRAPAAFFGKTP